MKTEPPVMVWEEPPRPEGRFGPKGGTPYQNRAGWVAELKKRPGEWAKWTGRAPARAAQLAAELRRDWPGVDAVARYGDVWARWLGADRVRPLKPRTPRPRKEGGSDGVV